jgi:DNA or RNA helicases of superfamily II
MPITLRDYQNATSDAVIEQWRTVQSTLVVLYTGGGKTIVFADLIKRVQPMRVLVIAHREELIDQAKRKIEASTGIRCEVEMANQCANTYLFDKAPVVIATVQTLISGGGNRMKKFKPTDFDVLIIDEAHHGTASSYRKIIDYFKTNPRFKIAGFTATPKRSDEIALGQIFESVAADYDILDGVQSGWLCDITQQFVTVGTLDYSHIKTTAGDFNSAQLAAVMEAEENIAGVCHPSLEVIFGLAPQTLKSIPVPEWSTYLSGLKKVPRRTIVFTASVAQAEALCNIFNRAYPDIAQWVCGATNKESRKEMLKDFSTGKTAVMVNCGVLTEGYDNPAVEVIIMARPTKSETLYRQMVGRSTRTLPGLVDGIVTPDARKAAIAASPKPFCRVIDFVGNSGKHKLARKRPETINCIDILGGKASEKTKTKAICDAIDGNKPVRVSKAISKADIDLENERLQKAEEARRRSEAKKATLVPKSSFSIQNISPFEVAQLMKTHSSISRDGRHFTDNQKRRLLKNGHIPSNLTFKQGQAILAKIFSKPTPEQAQCLIRAGYKPEELTMTMMQASKLIDQVKANGWKRLAA